MFDIFLVLILVTGMLVAFAIGLIIGIQKAEKRYPPKVGRINIDHSDLDGSSSLWLEIDKGMMSDLMPGRDVVVSVTENNYLDSTQE